MLASSKSSTSYPMDAYLTEDDLDKIQTEIQVDHKIIENFSLYFLSDVALMASS